MSPADAGFEMEEAERKAADGARTALGNDKKGVDSVVDMAEADAATALIFMNDAEQQFGVLQARIHDLNEILDKITARTVQEAGTLASRAAQLFFTLLAVSLLIARLIARPIVGMTQAMAALAKGDKQAEVGGADRGDESGAMAKAVLVFEENMIRADQLAAEQRASARSARSGRAASRTARRNSITASPA